MSPPADIATALILSALGMLALLGVAVLLIIVLHSRRARHRAAMAELQLKNADQLRQVEREVEQHTLKALGIELHDNVGQLLTSLRLDLLALQAIRDSHELATQAHGTLKKAAAEVRRLSHTLIDGTLLARPLSEALREECARLHRPGMLEVRCITGDHEPDLHPQQKVVLYRIFQEAVNNAMKHAQADRITVTLANNGTVRLGVQDNGLGFDPAGAGAGAGLATMRERAALIGFRLHITSAPGQGTHIIATA